MPDYNRSNTVEDLLRRYNLENLKRDHNKVYQLQGQLTNTNGILEDFVDKTTENMDLIKDQLDGNVTSWFYGYVPTLLNVPASNWTTDELKKEHLEDLFYNTDTGKVYKFEYNDTTQTYDWIEVTNIVGAQTLAVANAQQDVLDGNRRVFVVQPTPPYDIGDVWADNVNHILYRCNTPKATGETFLLSDWVNSLHYLSTDDGDKLVDSINDRTTTKTISADRLFIEGETINMTSKELSITSDHFSLDSEGRIQIKNNFTTGSSNAFKIIKDGSGDLDKYVAISYENIVLEEDDIFCSITTDSINFVDGVNYQSMSYGDMYSTPYEGYKGLHFIDYLSQQTIEFGKLTSGNMGLKIINGSNYTSINNLGTVIVNPSVDMRVQITGQGLGFVKNSTMTPTSTYYFYNGCSVDGQITSTAGMYAPFFQQTSLEEKKKNIEEADINALDIINNTDIYKFNYKFEDDNDKKHIGFVIGDNYKYSEEVTGKDNDGVDLYSFVSVCCKAIQEQQEEINKLKEEIKVLKEGKQ